MAGDSRDWIGFIHLLAPSNPKTGESKDIFALYREGMSTAELGEALSKHVTNRRKLSLGQVLTWDTDPKRKYGATIGPLIEVLPTAELCYQKAIGNLRERLAKLEQSTSLADKNSRR